MGGPQLKELNKIKLVAVLFLIALFCTSIPFSEAFFSIFKGKEQKEVEEISSEDATEFFTKKKYLKAKEAFVKLVNKDPDDLDYQGMLAWCEFMLDNHVAAQNIFRKIAKKDNGNFDGQLGMAWTHIKLGNYKKAKPYLQTAKDAAENWQAYMVLDAEGWLNAKLGNLKKAKELFGNEDGVLEDWQEDNMPADGRVGLAWAFMKEKKYKKAKEEFKEGLDRDEKCFFCHDGLARIALQSKNYEEALAQTVKGLKIVHFNNGLLSLLDTIFLTIKDTDKKIKILKELIETHSDDPKYLYVSRLAYVQMAAQKTKEAEKIFQLILKKDSGNFLARIGLSRIQYQKKKIVEDAWKEYARGEFEEALKKFNAKREEAKKKGNPAAEDGRGWTLLALEKPKKAYDAFQTALKIDKRFFFSYSGLIASQRLSFPTYNAAWRLTNYGKFKDAEETFQKARKEIPVKYHWLIDEGLGWIHYYKKDYSAAEKAFNNSIKIEKDAFLSHKGLAYVALENDNFEKAEKELMTSLGSNPSQVISTYIFPAQKFLKAKQFLKAKELLSLGERTYKFSADIQFLLARAFKGLKDPATASQKAMKSVKLAPAYVHPKFNDLELDPETIKDAYKHMGWGLYYAGKSKDALKRFDEYFSAGGEDNSAKLGKAWVLVALKKTEDAIELFEESLGDGEKKNISALLGIGWAKLKSDEVEEAEKRFRTVLKRIPGHYSASAGLARIQYRKTRIVKDAWKEYSKKNYKEALEKFNSKREDAEENNNPAAEDGRGWTLLALDKPKKAIKAFRAALKIDKQFFYSRSGLIAAQRKSLVSYSQAWGLLNIGRFKEALKSFQKARKETSPQLQWLVDDGLAWLAYYKKDYETAERIFSEILKKKPEAYLSQKGLGFVALQKEDFDNALKHLTASLEKNPYQPINSFTIPAVKFLKKKKYIKIKQLLTLGERTYPRSADIQFLLAKAYKGLGNEKKATQKGYLAAILAPAYIHPKFDELKLDSKKIKEAYNAMGWGLYYAGKSEEALKRFEEYFSNGGKNISGLIGKGRSQLALGKAKDAEKTFTKALGENKYITAQLWIGWAQLKSDKVKEAEKTFRSVLKRIPGHYSASAGLARIQYRKTRIVKDAWKEYSKKNYKEALEKFNTQRKEALKSRNPAAEDGRGWTLLALDKPKEALKAFQAALKIDKRFFYSRSGLIAAQRASFTSYNKAWIQANSGKFKESEKNFKIAKKEASKQLLWLIEEGLGWLAYYKKDFDTAKKTFTKVLKDKPEAYLSQKGLGFIALEKGDFDTALKQLRASLEKNPYQPISSFTIPARKFLEKNKYVKIKELLTLGERTYPRSADIQFLLAKAYKGLGNEKKATEKGYIAAILAPAYIHPKFDELKLDSEKVKEAFNAMGWGLYFSRKNKEALERFNQYIESGGSNPNAKRGLSFALFRLKKYKKSIPGLIKAASLEPKTLKPITEMILLPGTKRKWPIRYSAKSTLAWAYFRIGNTEKAEKQFQKVIQKNPFSLDALTGLGYVCLKLKKTKKAKKYFQDALKTNPYYPDAKRGMKLIKAKK